MIKAVLFDIDGVLIDSFEANLKYFQDLASKAGYPPPTREEYVPMFYIPLIEVIKKITKTEDEAEIKRIFELAQDRRAYPYHLLSSPPYTKEVVQRLSLNYDVGLVTSRVLAAIFSVHQLFELQPYLKTVISFEDTDKHKPDPEPLLLATQRLNIQPHETVYIGDAATDFHAARAAGTKIIMFRNQKVVGADGYAESFTELEEMLQVL